MSEGTSVKDVGVSDTIPYVRGGKSAMDARRDAERARERERQRSRRATMSETERERKRTSANQKIDF